MKFIIPVTLKLSKKEIQLLKDINKQDYGISLYTLEKFKKFNLIKYIRKNKYSSLKNVYLTEFAKMVIKVSDTFPDTERLPMVTMREPLLTDKMTKIVL